MYTPDLTPSVRASARWKRNTLRSTESKFSKADEKKIRRLISTHDAEKFISTSFTPGFDSPKISKNEDLREISVQLVQLKKKHDYSKNKNYFHQKILDKDAKFIEIFKAVESRSMNSTEFLQERIKELEKKYEEIKMKQDQDLATRKVYKHMLGRMKVNQVNFDIKNLNLNEFLKVNQQVLEEEKRKQRRTKEVNRKTKVELISLENFVVNQTKDKEEKLLVLKKDVDQQLKNTKKREFRLKRQFEIAESAADDDRNMRAMRIREGVMVHRLLYFLLNAKLQKSKIKFATIDEAFRKVKNSNGISDPKEMIEKILTKEQTYIELLNSVNITKTRIEELKVDHLSIEKKINDVNRMRTQSSDQNNEKKDKMLEIAKDLSQDKEKMMKITILYEKINIWVSRNAKKFGINGVQSGSLKNSFDVIRDFIIHCLRNVENQVKKLHPIEDHDIKIPVSNTFITENHGKEISVDE
jgi:myosin heavy subunit